MSASGLLGVPDLAPGQIRRPPPRLPQSQYHTVIPMSSATHTQIFSLLPCRSAGFLFWGFWPPGPPPRLFSQNAPTGCHSHALRYPHANFQPPSMSLGSSFIFGPLARPLAFFTKRTHRSSFPCPPLPTCKFSAS